MMSNHYQLMLSRSLAQASLHAQVKKGRMEGDMEYDVGPAESWTAKGVTAFLYPS